MAQQGEGVRVAVVGAGVVGMTTATMLQETLPRASITVMADKFGQDTTSDGAAGIFRPGLQFRGPKEGDARRWLADAYDYYKKIIASGEGGKAGVKKIAGFSLSNRNPKLLWNPFLVELLEEYRECTKEELKLHGYKYGTYMTTFLTECRLFLPYLTGLFTERGGKVIQRHLNSLEELVEQYDIVCNCSGFGAQTLCHDLTVTPIRGQVYKVKAPWIKNFHYLDFDTYIIPGFETITLGGTRNFDCYETEVNKYDSQSIWERCLEVVPSLKDAEIIREWVGWRPYRPHVRVEKEILTFSSGNILKVVHNYGHGGYGVMSAPGTSINAVKFVQEMLRGNQSKL